MHCIVLPSCGLLQVGLWGHLGIKFEFEQYQRRLSSLHLLDTTSIGVFRMLCVARSADEAEDGVSCRCARKLHSMVPTTSRFMSTAHHSSMRGATRLKSRRRLVAPSPKLTSTMLLHQMNTATQRFNDGALGYTPINDSRRPEIPGYAHRSFQQHVH